VAYERTEAARERGWTIDAPAHDGSAALTARTTVETEDGPKSLMVDATSLDELLERIERIDRESGRL
jgi:hypothetical protein